MAFVAVALGTVGTLYAALAPTGEAATSADPAVQRGQALYAHGCSSCHGLSGAGGQRAPSLIGVGAASVDFQVGTGRMPLREHGSQAPRKRPSYDEQQILDLAAYIASLGPGPAIPSFSSADWQKADTAYGGALFRTNCAQCHNFAGSGGELTYGKYAPSLSDATPTQIYEAMITGPENMPVFGDKQLTPDQKLAIINYIRTIKTEADPGGVGLGRVGPVTETIVGWLIGIGVLVVVTIWIGARA
jgi:ubiquinol-cytochrome c reductase cytochrome c subunit